MSKERALYFEFKPMADDLRKAEHWDDLDGALNRNKTMQNLYKMGYRKQSDWISVDERLPDVLQEVLVYRGNHIGNLMNAYTYVGGDMWKDEYGFGCRREDEGITHWMPLPEAPKGGEG